MKPEFGDTADTRRQGQVERFADRATARVALLAHDAYHDGLRCRYECDFWNGLVVAFREVDSAALIATLRGPGNISIPPAGGES